MSRLRTTGLATRWISAIPLYLVALTVAPDNGRSDNHSLDLLFLQHAARGTRFPLEKTSSPLLGVMPTRPVCGPEHVHCWGEGVGGRRCPRGWWFSPSFNFKLNVANRFAVTTKNPHACLQIYKHRCRKQVSGNGIHLCVCSVFL